MLRAWLIVISIATRHNIIQLEGTSVELEVYEMERSLGEKKQSTKLDIREDHSATINVAFLQAVEKRKLDASSRSTLVINFTIL